jgi:hypothetical protein
MSKPVNQNATRSCAGRLHENLKVAKRMEPYAHRLRLRLEHFDRSDPKIKQRLANARKKIEQILVRKKMRPGKARRAVARTFDIAVDYQLDGLRRDQDFRDLSRSQRDVRRLIEQVDHLGGVISKLQPLARGKLNKICGEAGLAEFRYRNICRSHSCDRRQIY